MTTRSSIKIFFALLLALTSCGGPVPLNTPKLPVGWGHDAVTPSQGHVPTQAPVLQLSINPTLIRGRVAAHDKFRSVVWIGNCTAAIVGSRVVYTAAHCVRGPVGFNFGASWYAGLCMIAREYAWGNSTADFALCQTAREITEVKSYENVNLDPSHISVGDEVLLSGFGCQKWGNGIDGKFRIGEAIVKRLPDRKNSDITTNEGSALCSGDSGGPAWSLKDGQRDRLISINSRSDRARTSYLSSTSSQIGQRFIKSWLRLHPLAEICGVSPGAKNCRTSEPPVPKGEEFEIDHKVAYIKGVAKPGYSATKIKADIIAWALNPMIEGK